MDRQPIARPTSTPVPDRSQQPANGGPPIKVDQAIATMPRQQGEFHVTVPPSHLSLPVGPSPSSRIVQYPLQPTNIPVPLAHMQPPLGHIPTHEYVKLLPRGWVCCQCKHAWTGVRQAGSYCSVCSHASCLRGGYKCAECWDVVCFGEIEMYLVDAIPNQRWPREIGWYHAAHGCDNHHLSYTDMAKWCRLCGDVGYLYGYTRRVD